MDTQKLLVGILFIGLGLVFICNNQNIAKGAFKFYAKLYTERNLIIMFRAAGIILVIGGIFLILFYFLIHKTRHFKRIGISNQHKLKIFYILLCNILNILWFNFIYMIEKVLCFIISYSG